MIIRLAQLDGKLPNLALMKLAHWHRSRGDDVHLVRGHRAARRDLFESASYDRVYGSAIFTTSAQRVQELLAVFPGAIIGGTWDPRETVTVEQIIGEVEYDYCDYSIYPDFSASIGFTQRGYRLKCGFCVVPHKEGKLRAVGAITEI